MVDRNYDRRIMSKNPGVYTALQSAVKTFELNFVIFFVYFGNSSFDYLWNFFLCYGSKAGNHFARNLCAFGVARSEELEVSQWIALDIPTLSSQSEGAKNTIHCFSMY